MRMDCESAREHVEAWSLGALDDQERRPFETHIAGCAACGALAGAAADDAALVGLAAPIVSSSAALKSRVLGSAAVLTDIRRPRRHWRAAAVVGTAVAFAGALAWGAWAQERVGDLERDRDVMAQSATAQSAELVALQTRTIGEPAFEAADAALRDAALEVAFGPDAEWTELTGTSAAPLAAGKCVWSRVEAIGAFVAEKLPPLGANQWYELWLVYDGDWLSAGTMKVDASGYGKLLMKGPWGREGLGAFRGFAVTIEPTDPSAGKGRQGSMVLASFLNPR